MGKSLVWCHAPLDGFGVFIREYQLISLNEFNFQSYPLHTSINFFLSGILSNFSLANSMTHFNGWKQNITESDIKSVEVLCMMKCRHVAWTGLMVCSCVPKHLTWIKTDSFASKSVFFYIYLTANDGIPNISLRNFRICQVVAGDRCFMEIFTSIRSTTAIWTCLGLTLEKENTEGWERNVISKST